MTYKDKMYSWGFGVGYDYSCKDEVTEENFKEYIMSGYESAIKRWEQEGRHQVVDELRAERELFITLNEEQINECFEEFIRGVSDGVRA